MKTEYSSNEQKVIPVEVLEKIALIAPQRICFALLIVLSNYINKRLTSGITCKQKTVHLQSSSKQQQRLELFLLIDRPT